MPFKFLLLASSGMGVLLSLIAEVMPGESQIFNHAANGGIVVILFAILWFAFKYFSTTLEKSQKQNQELVANTVAQIQSLNTQYISQITNMQEETNKQNKNNLDRLFSVVEENSKSFAFLSQVITKMDGKLDTHIQAHNLERK